MEKYTTKKRVDYSIDKETIEKFNKISKERAINKSGLVELLINQWIKKQEENDNN